MVELPCWHNFFKQPLMAVCIQGRPYFKSTSMKKIYASNFGICLVLILAFYVMMVWLPRLF